MNRLITRALWGTLLAGGLTLVGTTVAAAAETDGQDGLLSGTQAVIDVAVPASISDNGISLIGDSASDGGASAASDAGASEGVGSAATSGERGTASGSQALVSVRVPVTVERNAVSVVGDTEAGAGERAPADDSGDSASPAVEPPVTSGRDGAASGTQAVVPVDLPITVGSNAISVLGDSTSTGTTPRTGTPDANGTGTAGGTTTDGADGIASGTQVIAPVDLPITVGSNAISVLGDSTSGSTAPAVPSVPTVPSGPETPVTPVDPVDPAAPTDRGAPGAPSVPSAGSAPDMAVSGDAAGGEIAGTPTATSTVLAATGGSGLPPLLALASVLMFGGAVLRLTHRTV